MWIENGKPPLGSSSQLTDNNQKEEKEILVTLTRSQKWKRSSFHLRLLSRLSPQRGQGQAPSPRDNRPHSHRCNRRALLGGLWHPPHIPLPGTCQLWRGPGDLSAPSRRWGGRGVDGGIRAERSFSLDLRVWKLLAQRILRVIDWNGGFSPKNKRISCIERWWPWKTLNQEECPENGPSGKKWWITRRVARGLDTEWTVHEHMIKESMKW